jgi:hypothetical protein
MTYEGWANYQTWNVALHIQNEYNLYKLACDYALKTYNATYEQFIGEYMPQEYGDVTGDGVSWTDPTLDHKALDEMLAEMAE